MQNKLLDFQKNEITEYHIYRRLSQLEKDPGNQKVLEKISGEEAEHYQVWRKYTGREVSPNKIKIWAYILLARLLGPTFALKIMESGEDKAQKSYSEILSNIPEAQKIIEDETGHEKALVKMIDEERLKYIGSVVLGLNDALVELSGTLAGLTFALQNSKIIGMAGLITGIAAALSMAASEYLSTKTEGGEKNPLRAAIYTGLTYIFAVSLLVLPYLLLSNYYLALMITFAVVISLIFVFTFYYSVVREVAFRQRFLEMLVVSLGVAGLSFAIGLLVRQLLGIEV